MRRIGLVFLVVVSISAAALHAAQTAPLSPRVTSEGIVDSVKISIEYGAPAKRGRMIWGGLRPWDEWWMPGADLATTITTSAPLMVADLRVPAGDHTSIRFPARRSPC